MLTSERRTSLDFGAKESRPGTEASPTFNHSHVLPPSFERATPGPSAPAYTVPGFRGSISIQCTTVLASFVPARVQERPPSVLFHTPPPCVPAYNVSDERVRRPARECIRTMALPTSTLLHPHAM